MVFIWFFGVAFTRFGELLRRVFYFYCNLFCKYKYVVYLCGNKIRKKMNDTKEFHDELDPKMLFRTTLNDLLCKIASGEIDPVQLAKKELANRGLNASGEWVGFDKAAKIHGTK